MGTYEYYYLHWKRVGSDENSFCGTQETGIKLGHDRSEALRKAADHIRDTAADWRETSPDFQMEWKVVDNFGGVVEEGVA